MGLSVCVKCGQPITRPGSLRYCSNVCRRTDPAEGFWSRVRKSDGCWSWAGSKTDRGYGQIEVSWRSPGRLLAHRLSWEIHFGPIPAGMFVCHKCDNPECANPNHLFLGTHLDNVKDRIVKQRDAKGERSSNAKITADTARKIVALSRSGVRAKDIEAILGLGRGCVYSVTHGISWSHETGLTRRWSPCRNRPRLVATEKAIGISETRGA